MLNSDDVKIIKGIVDGALATVNKRFAKIDEQFAGVNLNIAKLDTKFVKFEVKTDENSARLENKMDKGFAEVKKAVQEEHGIGNDDFGYLESEDQKIKQRVEKMEHHLGFAPT